VSISQQSRPVDWKANEGRGWTLCSREDVPHDEAEVEMTNEDECPGCGYRPRAEDMFEVVDYQVMHVICYRCGHEWVE
jgi:DNA-directed RNA polymerase subunit RPC12/RpoP